MKISNPYLSKLVFQTRLPLPAVNMNRYIPIIDGVKCPYQELMMHPKFAHWEKLKSPTPTIYNYYAPLQYRFQFRHNDKKINAHIATYNYQTAFCNTIVDIEMEDIGKFGAKIAKEIVSEICWVGYDKLLREGLVLHRVDIRYDVKGKCFDYFPYVPNFESAYPQGDNDSIKSLIVGSYHTCPTFDVCDKSTHLDGNSPYTAFWSFNSTMVMTPSFVGIVGSLKNPFQLMIFYRKTLLKDKDLPAAFIDNVWKVGLNYAMDHVSGQEQAVITQVLQKYQSNFTLDRKNWSRVRDAADLIAGLD